MSRDGCAYSVLQSREEIASSAWRCANKLKRKISAPRAAKMGAETYTAGPYAISMHQPWASLLVYGIKRIEGRSWPTTFRGRLWIHATSVIPKADVIQVRCKLFIYLFDNFACSEAHI